MELKTRKNSEGKYYREGDLPKDELVKLANKTIADSGGPENVEVFFKFTCEKCGERCTFQEPNSIYEFGECCECGHNTLFTKGGYALHFWIGGKPQK